MKKLLYLTNLHNGAREEDDHLSSELKKYFELIICHPLECEPFLSSVSGVVIRNVWPCVEYLDDWKRIVKLFKDSKIPTYNPLTGKGDLLGKDYLVDLYNKKFSVIPSVDSIENIGLLPESEFYWIKPKEGGDGSGAEKLSKKDLLKRSLRDYIIQPYMEFVSEPSFFFIDNKFAYAITMPNRLADKNIEVYDPTSTDIELAQKFVDWNGMKYGIQRIDFVKLRDGSLLLTEVEDAAPYLYFLDIDEGVRNEIISSLVGSIKAKFTLKKSVSL